MSKMETLLRSGQNVFTVDDLRVYWNETNPDHVKSQAKYLADRKKLFRVRRGIYSVDPIPPELELAQKLIIPSYISLDTALVFHGVIRQMSSAIHSTACYYRKIQVLQKTFVYHKIPEKILINPIGVKIEKYWTMASAERAICDWIFLRGKHFFDNLKKIDPVFLKQVANIYHSNTLKEHINTLIKTL